MRKIIRKWLGVDSIEAAIPKPTSQDDLRLMIGEAFSDALDGKEDSPWNQIFSMYHIPNKLEKALDKASRQTAGDVAEAHIAFRIKPESFIDEVVERIKKKQLG